jgi:hypothetical protein
LILLGLMGACAPTNPKSATSSNMESALPALSHSWEADNAAALEPPVAVQKQRMPPLLSYSLIALL